MLAAAWLWLMTSVSPCPLATNIAAVSFLARRLDTKQRAIAGVLAYATGRAVAYVAVGVLVAWGIAAAPQTSRFLQVYAQYKNAPEVTRRRMFLETMERVLGGTDKIILDNKGSAVVPYLPLDRLQNRPSSTTEGGN